MEARQKHRIGRLGLRAAFGMHCAYVLVFFLALRTSDAAKSEANLGPVLPKGNYSESSKIPLTCRVDRGYPNGVSCSERDYFVQGYDKYRDDRSEEGLKPYTIQGVSCCTPEEEGGVVKSIQVKCGTRRNVQNCALLHDHSANLSSFISGWSSSATLDNFYRYAPAGEAVCCDAVAEVDNGVWRYINPCDCVVTDDVMCPAAVSITSSSDDGQATGFPRIMTGFLDEDVKKGVPVTPVECCGMCLGDIVPPDSDCSRYNQCNGKGVYHSGFCECVDGYSGLDCSFKKTKTMKQLFRNLVWELQVWGMCGFIIGLWILCCGCANSDSDSGRRRRRSRARVLGDEREEPLLNYIELMNSDSSEEEMESSSSEEDEEPPSAPPQCSVEDEETGNALKAGSSGSALLKSPEGEDASCCSICMMSSKGKFVVLVPCGHTGLCKKCAKRVNFCPFCRAQIYRRQKIFMPS